MPTDIISEITSHLEPADKGNLYWAMNMNESHEEVLFIGFAGARYGNIEMIKYAYDHLDFKEYTGSIWTEEYGYTRENYIEDMFWEAVNSENLVSIEWIMEDFTRNYPYRIDVTRGGYENIVIDIETGHMIDTNEEDRLFLRLRSAIFNNRSFFYTSYDVYTVIRDYYLKWSQEYKYIDLPANRKKKRKPEPKQHSPEMKDAKYLNIDYVESSNLEYQLVYNWEECEDVQVLGYYLGKLRDELLEKISKGKIVKYAGIYSSFVKHANVKELDRDSITFINHIPWKGVIHPWSYELYNLILSDHAVVLNENILDRMFLLSVTEFRDLMDKYSDRIIKMRSGFLIASYYDDTKLIRLNTQIVELNFQRIELEVF